MSALERRYRRALRILPGWYRDRWEDEMVASFMEGAYAADPDADLVDVGRPRVAELLSVAALALRLRLGGDGSPPRALAWREAWRRVALLTLLYSGAFAVIRCVMLFSLVHDGRFVRPSDEIVNSSTYWLSYVSPLFELPWLVAFLLLVSGRLRGARDFAVAGSVLSLAVPVVSTVVGEGPLWTYELILTELWIVAPAIVLVVLSVAAPSVEPALSRRARVAWLGGFGLFLAAAAAITIMMRVPGSAAWDVISMPCVALVAATIGLLVAGIASGGHSAPWLLALAVVGAGMALVRWLTVGYGIYFDGAELYRQIGTGVAILTLAVAGIAAVVGHAALRRESPTPTAPLRVGG